MHSAKLAGYTTNGCIFMLILFIVQLFKAFLAIMSTIQMGFFFRLQQFVTSVNFRGADSGVQLVSNCSPDFLYYFVRGDFIQPEGFFPLPGQLEIHQSKLLHSFTNSIFISGIQDKATYRFECQKKYQRCKAYVRAATINRC